MKVTINIELEGQPNKLGQDFADWCKSMRADMDRLTVSGRVPDKDQDAGSNASNQYVPPKYMRDEPTPFDDVVAGIQMMSPDGGKAAAEKLDAVKVDPFRPLQRGNVAADYYPPAFINEFNHLLDARRLEFRDTLLRVFSDATPEECSRILQKKGPMSARELVNEVLRRRRGEA